MASKQELQVQQKRELEKKEETTVPARAFVPMADIYETADALTVVMEMPGVDNGNVEIRVEEDVLKVDGKLDFSKYQASATMRRRPLLKQVSRLDDFLAIRQGSAAL